MEREILGRDAGRLLFGQDPAGYDAARPGHAEEVYEILRERCGLRPGSKVLEVGPGTGQATRRLLVLGADPLVALEPDPGLAAFLRKSLDERIEIRPTTLEAAELEDDFDLATAASSFHWVDEDVGLARFRDALRPGGWLALWWTVFGDARRPDPFRDAVDPLVHELPRSPSEATGGRPTFAHDGEARVAALAARRVRRDRAPPDRVGAHLGCRGDPRPLRDLLADSCPRSRPARRSPRRDPAHRRAGLRRPGDEAGRDRALHRA